MALSLNKFALVDSVQIGFPLTLACCNGVDQPWWTDGLESGRSEETLSTTAPDISTGPMTVTDASAGTGIFPDATKLTIFITYVREATATYQAMESGPSEPHEHTTASVDVDLDLATIPVSGDAQVTHKNIYIIGSTMSAPFYVDQITNATTTYTIDTAEATIATQGIMDEGSGSWPKKRNLANALPPIFERLEYFIFYRIITHESTSGIVKFPYILYSCLWRLTNGECGK